MKLQFIELLVVSFLFVFYISFYLYFFIESQSTEPKTKTEEQDETSIDMYDDEFHLIMENDFAATAENVNEVSEALSVNEESETDSDATEIDDENYEAVSGKWAVGFIYIFV